MAIYMVAHPDRLLTRLSGNAAWADNAGWPTVVQRIVHTYFQHLGSVDFLFRTGQHRVWHNAGEGLLAVWMAIPLGLGLGSLWVRRKDAFARVVLMAILLSPIPVCLTLQPDFPHTSRSLQFVPLAIIAVALAISDFFLRQKLPRWIPVLALAGALLEGGQDLRIYFKDYAVEQERTLDDDIGPALRIVFAHRTGEEKRLPPRRVLRQMPGASFSPSGETSIQCACETSASRGWDCTERRALRPVPVPCWSPMAPIQGHPVQRFSVRRRWARLRWARRRWSRTAPLPGVSFEPPPRLERTAQFGDCATPPT